MLDNFRKTRIVWDKASQQVQDFTRASSSDNHGRKLSVQVTDEGREVDLTGSTLSLYWETADKSAQGLDYFVPVDTAKGQYEIYYTPEMLSNVGYLKASLVLIGSSGRIVSEAFRITVFKGFDEGAVVGQSSFTALTEALVKVEEWDGKFETKYMGLENEYAGNITNLTVQLEQSNYAKKRIKNGKIKLPSTFPKLPFDIFKMSDWKYTHNATPQNQHDWSTATEVFIAGLGGGSGLGTSASSPIALETFHANVSNNLYGAQNDFILSFLNTYYTVYTSINLGSLHKNLYLRSRSLKGKTYMHPFILQGGSAITQPWVSDNGIFKTITNASMIFDPINVGAGEDEFGISNPHQEMASLTECRNTIGSYYFDVTTKTMYLHPYPGESIEDVEIIQRIGNRIFDISNTSNNVLIFENLHFINKAYVFNPSTINTKLYFFGCRFYRGAQDAFSITGAFTVYLFDCVGAYPNKDAFNYHTTDSNSLAVEINGRGYGAGQYKYLNIGNQGRGSNNGSTAHDGMHMLRVGGEYWDCEGPIIADVGNCYSISIGCRSFDILPTATTSLMTGLYVENQEGLTLEQEKPKYFIECEQHGKYFTQGVRGVRSNKTYVQAVNVDIGEGQLIDWEDVV